MELVAFVPDISRQPVGGLFCIGLIRFHLRHHNDAAASHWCVVPDVAHMPAHAADTRVLLQFVHILVDGTHGLVAGNALFTAQNQRQLAIHRMDVLSILHKVAQHGCHLAHGGNAVGVGRLPVAADQGRGLCILPAQVAMRVAHHEDGQVRAHDLADLRQDVVVAGTDFFHLACTMQHQEHAVDLMDVLPDGTHKAGLDVIKGILFDHTCSASIGQYRRDQLKAGLLKDICHMQCPDAIIPKKHLIVADLALLRDICIGFRDKFTNQDLHRCILLFVVMRRSSVRSRAGLLFHALVQ